MASLQFPDSGSRQVLYSNGDFAVNAAGTLYADNTLTTLAEVYADNAGTPGPLITTAQVTCDAYGRLPDFWGPAAGGDHLWIVVSGGPGARVDAAYGPRIATNTSTVAAIIAAPYETTAGSQAKATAAQTAAAGIAAALAIVFGG